MSTPNVQMCGVMALVKGSEVLHLRKEKLRKNAEYGIVLYIPEEVDQQVYD